MEVKISMRKTFDRRLCLTFFCDSTDITTYKLSLHNKPPSKTHLLPWKKLTFKNNRIKSPYL